MRFSRLHIKLLNTLISRNTFPFVMMSVVKEIFLVKVVTKSARATGNKPEIAPSYVAFISSCGIAYREY